MLTADWAADPPTVFCCLDLDTEVAGVCCLVVLILLLILLLRIVLMLLVEEEEDEEEDDDDDECFIVLVRLDKTLVL